RAIAIWPFDEEFAAFAIPIVFAAEAHAGQPAGAFKAIKVVIGGAGNFQGKVAAEALGGRAVEPAKALGQRLIVAVDAAVIDFADGRPRFATAVELGAGDEQAAQAGDRHGDRRFIHAFVIGRITPGAARLLRSCVV